MSPSDYYVEKREEMFDFIPDGSRKILDVGCGAAEFSAAIKHKLGAEVWGIELNEEAAESAAGKLDRVIVGDIEQALDSLPDNGFDCIIFNDVLEHLVDPYSVLQSFRAKIADHGVIVCSIPNVRHFSVLFELVVLKKWEYRDDGILDRTHLRFFTRSSIADMIQGSEYELLRLEGINKTSSLLVRMVNILSLGWFSDSLYLQFACVARPQKQVQIAGSSFE